MKWNRMKLHRWIIGLLVIFSSFLPTRGVEAADAWALAAEALGVLAAYQSSLASMLSLGNDVNAQIAGRVQDEQQNGMDPNEHDQAVVRRVMTKLINQGEYELQVNSLPFAYFVNNNPMFNAACYPTNYIS
ncbi:MAG: peptidase M48, partial [Selenomonadaceae bacterium]|nr:peptidase M48 [Selenomonadaceae bacterium]